MKDEALTNLKKYYKRILTCTRPSCGQIYGSDKKSDTGYCPDCLWMLQGKRSSHSKVLKKLSEPLEMAEKGVPGVRSDEL